MRAAVIALVLALGAVAHANPLQELGKAQRSWKQKDWSGARQILKDLLYPKPQLARTSDLVEAHVILGVCHYEEGRREEAKSEFEAALALDPTKTLESISYTEGQIRLFDEVRTDVEARAKRDRELRELEERNERIRRLLENTRQYETRSWAVNFVPFGAGQYQNGDRTKGILFSIGQGATAATSLGIFLYLAGNYGLEAKVPLEDGPRVRRLQQAQVVTGGAFFLLYGWSVFDGLWNFKPRVQVDVDPALLEELKKTSPKQKTSRVRFGPVLFEDGAGVGIAWEND
jgi:tetratricopeptide (TPR) repeat protein